MEARKGSSEGRHSVWGKAKAPGEDVEAHSNLLPRGASVQAIR